VAYLPPAYLEDGAFPTSVDMDLITQLRMVAEKWRRFYPIVDYYVIHKDNTVIDHATPVATSPDQKNLITGAAGATQFDTLYRERVPVALHTTGWQQPHSAPAVAAAEEEVFYPPVQLHVRFRFDATDREIKRWGFDKVKDVLVLVPTILLDQIGITVVEGDKFTHGGIDYLVERANVQGYWKNTNVPLYVALDCEQKRRGD
jgi:hypothetical protein